MSEDLESHDRRLLNWIMPCLLGVIVIFTGWASVNINRISEAVAVIAYRQETESGARKELGGRVEQLERYVFLRGRNDERSKN